MSRSIPGPNATNPKPAGAASRPSSPRRARRSTFWLVFGAGALLMCGLGGWEHHRQSRRLESAGSEIQSLQEANADLEQQRRETAERLDARTTELQDRMADLDESRSQAATLTDEREAAILKNRLALEASRRLATRTLTQWSSLVPQLTLDPALCRDVWTEAQRLAAEQGLDGAAAAEALKRLPVARTLPTGTRLTVVAVTHEHDSWFVDLTVTDARGGFVSGLSRVDFDVHRGEQRLHAVTVIETNRSTGRCDIALLLDASASTAGPANEALKVAAIPFVETLAHPSRLKVWKFADTVDPLTPWTFDADVHAAAIRSLVPNGGTALYRALRLSAEELRSRPGARAIVLFTDGNDSFRQEPLDSVLTLCRQAEIPVHVVALQTRETNTDLLQRMASATGGTFHAVAHPERLIDEFQAIAWSFQRPVYRLRIDEPLDGSALTIRVGGLPAILVPVETRQP